MTQKLTTQQQVIALKKSIREECRNYLQAIEQGEPNCVLEAITNKVQKLTIILEVLYGLDEANGKVATLKKAEFVDNSEQILHAEVYVAG